MPINKLLRTLILAIVAIGLVLVIFFSLTIFYSKPVNIYGKEKKAEAADYANCIILYPNQVIFITKGSRDTLTPEQIVPSIQNNRQSVSKSTFNIIVSPKTDFGMIVQKLDACTSSALKDYRLLEL
jgi:hypothetical protein